MTLKNFFLTEYEKNPKEAVSNLGDDTFLKRNGWQRVFRENYGEGIFSPNENIVVIYDDLDLEEYHDYSFYEYDNNWKNLKELFLN